MKYASFFQDNAGSQPFWLVNPYRKTVVGVTFEIFVLDSHRSSTKERMSPLDSSNGYIIIQAKIIEKSKKIISICAAECWVV